MAALPKEIQYNKPMASLPMDTTMNNITVRPSNSQVFSLGGEIVQFDLPAHSFLVPSSMTLRGRIKISAATAAAVQAHISGVPANPHRRSARRVVDTARGDHRRWGASRVSE